VQEVLRDVFHWSTAHPKLGIEVSSYWLDADGIAIDPLLPPQMMDWLRERPVRPTDVLLSNRHHYRDSGALVEEFDATVHCNAAGLHEFGEQQHVRGFEPGEMLPGGVIAFEIDAISPDDTALVLPGVRAVVLADAVIRMEGRKEGGPLRFVSDGLMDDPERDKAAILAALERLLAEIDFDHLLLAHGGPVIGDGRDQLQRFVSAGGVSASEG
jgi:hypothetical protein